MPFIELNDEIISNMSIGAVFADNAGKTSSIDFHRTKDLLVVASEDDSVRLYNIAAAVLVKTTYYKSHGADRLCFTHHPSAIVCSARYNLKSGESLQYISLYDNRCLRYFRGHIERVVSLSMSPVNDSFMSGSLDHTVRFWDIRSNSCKGFLHVKGRPTCSYDQQGLIFAVAIDGVIKLFDSRSYDKGPFDTFLVGDNAVICDLKFSNDGKSILLTTTKSCIYVLDAYGGDKRCELTVEPSPVSAIEASFTPDSQYMIAGSGDGKLHVWNVNTAKEVACWSSYIGMPCCVKWAPRRAMFASTSMLVTFWIPNIKSIDTQMDDGNVST